MPTATYRTLLSVLAMGFLLVVEGQYNYPGSPCQLRNKRGTCQLLEQCRPVYQELIAGKRPEVVCGYQNNMPIVCCPNRNGDSSSGSRYTTSTNSGPVWGGATRTTTTVRTVTKGPNVRRARQMCHEYAKSVYTLVQPPVLAGGDRQYVNVSLCAIKSKKLIVGGTKAEPKEFPHMAAVGFSSNDTNERIRWNCGGSLISELYVLTAAHCTHSVQWGNADWVRVGDLNLNHADDDARPQTRSVVERIRHPSYRRPSQYNDIALLKMNKPVTFDAYVRPACLSLSSKIIPNEKTVVSGWGIVDWFNEKGSPDLLKVTLPIVDYPTCGKYFANEGGRLPQGIDSKTQICAGQEGKDTCQGDSGGPLMIYSNNEECMYDVIGITSFGKLCGSVTPGIYTKVYSYLDWIEKIVWP